MGLESDHRIYEFRNPKLWGPSFWTFLYLTVLGLPVTLSKSQQSELSQLIKKFYIYLPCMECRYHYYNMIKTVDTNVRTREESFDLILNLHNNVRKRLKKKQLTKEDVLSYFDRMNKLKRYTDLLKKYIVPIVCILLVAFTVLRRVQ